MPVIARLGLRQLIMLLVLAGLLVTLVNVYFTTGSMQEQSLRQYELSEHQQRVRSFARRLSDVSPGERPVVLAELLSSGETRAYLLDAEDNVLFSIGKEPDPALFRAMGRDGRAVIELDGIQYLAGQAAMANGDRIVLQQPLSEGGVKGDLLGSIVLYSLPAVVLILLLAWLLAGWIVRPLKMLASYTRQLGQADMAELLRRVPVRSKEMADLKTGLLSSLEQAHPGLVRRATEGTQDELTGLSSPTVLPELLTNITTSGMAFATLVLAVDDYDQVLENFGRELTDQGLKELASLVLQGSRELDVSVRMGDEIFLLLLPQCPVVIAQRIAERLRGRVETHQFPGLGHMTISVGVAAFQPGQDAMSVLKAAQQMLIQARGQGQNRVCVAEG